MSEHTYKFGDPITLTIDGEDYEGFYRDIGSARGKHWCLAHRPGNEPGDQTSLEYVNDADIRPRVQPAPEPSEPDVSGIASDCCNAPVRPFGMDEAEFGWATARTVNRGLEYVAGLVEEWVPDAPEPVAKAKSAGLTILDAAMHTPYPAAKTA